MEHDQGKIEAIAKKCKDSLKNKKLFHAGDDSIKWGPIAHGKTHYYAFVAWRDGCKGPAQDPWSPKKGYDCETILKENFDFEWCEKGQSDDGEGTPSWGLPYGGYTDIGCLTYRSWHTDGGRKMKFR